MTERPILFNAEMVRAVLDGRKTQTRRVIKLPGDPETEWGCCPLKGFPGMFTFWESEYPEEGSHNRRCPYGAPGDRLWVRETWAHDDMLTEPNRDCICFRADGAIHEYVYYTNRTNDLCGESFKHPDPKPDRWRPSIHMPRWASRITLEVTDVRVERVQDISDADAVAEGIKPAPVLYDGAQREVFSLLWDSINAKRGYGWVDNPWVWVVTFKLVTP